MPFKTMNRIPACLTRVCQFCCLALTLALAGCATTTLPTRTTAESDSPAVMSLLEQARNEAARGHYNGAEASLERALRIEPGNAYLWYELAQTSMQQGQLQQAENFALRASSFAGQNRLLKENIWRLIGQSRIGRGNEQGAEEAFRKARSY